MDDEAGMAEAGKAGKAGMAEAGKAGFPIDTKRTLLIGT